MKIKLAILDSDKSYLGRIVSVFTTKYADKFEVYSFTDLDVALDTLEKAKMDVLIASDLFEINPQTLPRRCGFAYFVESADVGMINGQKAICKYQMVSDICNEINDLYAEKKDQLSITLKGNANGKKIITFLSPAGGVGTSSAAAGCARRFANKGETVLYLNLEHFGSADLFFSGEGNWGLSRVIYALEMGNSTVSAKLQGALKQDISGVYFYSDCLSALDLLSMDNDTMEHLYEELSGISLFDWIVVDMDCALEERVYAQIERSLSTVLVTDGSENANHKLSDCLEAFQIIGEQRQSFPLERIYIMYNRFSSKYGHKMENMQFKEVGGINRFENATAQEMVKLIANNKVYDELMN